MSAKLEQVNRRTSRSVTGAAAGRSSAEKQATNKAVIYVRASLDHTGEGLSVARQRASCESYCAARGWQVVEVCEDNSVSAYKGKARPGWERALQLSRDGQVSAIVAWHIDRVTRNMKDLEELIQVVDAAGVSLATVEGDININGDTGRLIARILAAVAIGEVERKGARQKAAHDQRAASGKRFTGGGRPFGFEVDGNHRPAEAEVLQEIVTRRLKGESWTKLAADLNGRGIVTTRGNKWDGATVSRTVRHPRNAGILLHRGNAVAEGDWEPIIEYADWLAIADEATAVGKIASAAAPVGRKPKSLLAGVARCAEHDKPSKLRKGYKGVPVYFFECCNSSIPTEIADTAARKAVFREAGSVAAMLQQEHQAGTNGKRASELRTERAELADRLSEATDMFSAGEVDRTQLAAISAEVTPKIEAIDMELVRYVRQGSRLDGRYSLGKLREEWNVMDLDECRRAVQAYVAKVDVKKRAHRRVPASADMLTITALDGRIL